jgi:hypothetical protein
MTRKPGEPTQQLSSGPWASSAPAALACRKIHRSGELESPHERVLGGSRRGADAAADERGSAIVASQVPYGVSQGADGLLGFQGRFP